MSRFSFSVWVVATAALVSECDAVASSMGFHVFNYRGACPYSTERNNKEELTLPGAQLFISPNDSFDFVPSPGYSVSVKFLEEDPLFLGTSDQAIVRGSDENLANWAASRLVGHEGKPTLQKHISPRPNESLSGKILTVEAAEVVARADQAVLCHALEKDAHVCHKLHKPMDITEVTVSPNGKASKLWVACHYGEGNDTGTSCHVMNMEDYMYVSTEHVVSVLPGDMTTMGKIRKKGLKTTARDSFGVDYTYTLISESHVMQSEYSTKAEIEQLGICAETHHSAEAGLPHFVATTILDHTDAGKIHDPDTPVKIIKYDENFDVQEVIEMIKHNVVAITFIIPLENKECLATIEEDEEKSLAYTLEIYASKTGPSELSDYTNGPCKDQRVEYAHPVEDGMEEEA